MNPAQTLIDTIVTELERSFGPDGYAVRATEPAESAIGQGESGDEKEIYVTTGGMSFPEGIADMGGTTRVLIPVIVSTVMSWPTTPDLTAAVLRRRLTVVQALQRAATSHATDHPEHVIDIAVDDEEPQNIDGYYVSILGIQLTFDLPTMEAL